MNGIKRWLIVLAGIPGFVWGQAEVFKGRVVDSVEVTQGTFLSYYLPVNYDEKSSWPVIYSFDPSGNSHKAVASFQDAAEKYGYIVLSCDAIKNGSYQENYKHARDLFEASETMFNLDTVNQFTAGFSGGGRLAMAIAGLSNDISGVISAGAGLSTASTNWLRNHPFIFIGISGNEDFNYTEVKMTERIFTALKYPIEIITFEGGHEWPPSEVIEKAVRDLSVLMFSRGKLKYTEEKLSEIWEEELTYNTTLQKKGHWVWAYKDLEKKRDWYAIYDRDNELKDMQRDIRRNKQYRSQRSEMKYVDEIEALYLQEYVDFLIEDIRAGELEALGYWDQELSQFDRSFTKSKKEAEKDMSVRIKSMLEVIALQAKTSLEEPEAFDQLLFINIFLTLLDDQDHGAYLEAVRLAVATGKYDVALYYTDKLLETGFKDIDRLRNYPGITLLRIQPEFGDVLLKYGFKPRF
ncbi:hypothetical protein E7Z59_12220 [Robertkochia marina]|uniref:Alpha/beta hydrolase n=1 Tax=Robertkochia marina TaxID=1227945 RepID=A0A4S3M0S7_9FLAO|nr:hypothetical protein [Robertkochia marina]THD66553.1 hypothetical protein E7Z59_12220 [Robertkochia marina]TRZ45607.1 hypothetical protein D3A96_06410 [Robertkochia marina]